MSIANPFSLEGKRALVVGASRGIGLAIAQAMARAGAHTILAARSKDALEKAAAALSAEGCKAEVGIVDTGSTDSVRALVAATGDVDIVAGVSGSNIRKHFADFTEEEYERLMSVNLKGLFVLAQETGRRMVARGRGGKMIFIGSLTSGFGIPHVGVYNLTKSAIAGMARSLAAEYGKHDIQVNCIAPGFIVTDLNREVWTRQDMNDWLKSVQAMPRTGKPEEIASLALFLASAGSSYITGQTIYVDGGFSTTTNWPFQP